MLQKTQLLDSVKFPADIRGFNKEQLRQLADEVARRNYPICIRNGWSFGRGAWRGRVDRSFASCV